MYDLAVTLVKQKSDFKIKKKNKITPKPQSHQKEATILLECI